ncbi:MAG: RNA methyltransferase [Planctomycetota bacterium]
MNFERIQRFRDLAHRRQRGMVVLEDCHDLHNAAAVMRSCDAFGLQRIALIFENELGFSPRRKGKTSSAGTNLWLDIDVHRSAERALRSIKDEGYTLVATAFTDGAEDLFEADLTDPNLALMLGNERDGLSETAMSMADRVLHIPMQGVAKSLNLSVTASVCLYEIARQRKRAGLDRYLLSKEDAEDLTRRLVERREGWWGLKLLEELTIDGPPSAARRWG